MTSGNLVTNRFVWSSAEIGWLDGHYQLTVDHLMDSRQLKMFYEGLDSALANYRVEVLEVVAAGGSGSPGTVTLGLSSLDFDASRLQVALESRARQRSELADRARAVDDHKARALLEVLHTQPVLPGR